MISVKTEFGLSGPGETDRTQRQRSFPSFVIGDSNDVFITYNFPPPAISL